MSIAHSSALEKQGLTVIMAGIVSALFAEKHSCQEPALIAVGGPGGCGKSSFCRHLKKELKDAGVLSLDHYKTPRTVREKKGIFGPHPQANDMDLISEQLAMLKMGLSIAKPVYNPQLGYIDRTISFSPTKYIILDGEIASYPEFSGFIDFLIFIDSDLNTQLKTRFTRDITERGYSHKKAIATFVGSNLREFRHYGAPTKKKADIVLFCAGDYSLSIERVSSDIENIIGNSNILADP